MRVMQHPWGLAAMATTGALLALLTISLMATFFALAVFLVRKSRK
jgi:hypothetical protein